MNPDPEKAALRERVRGLEEALEPFARVVSDETGDLHDETVVQLIYNDPEWGDGTLITELFLRPFRKARALLPLPEGGRGKAAQSQPLTDAGPYPRSPEPQRSDGKEEA